MNSNLAIKELTKIPGIGKSAAKDLLSIGIESISDLKGKNAEQMYDLLNRVSGFTQNKCFVYAFRCAIYYAETPKEIQEPEKLQWWYWKKSN
jgi:hypothetical protein